jgi:hypothetical protein
MEELSALVQFRCVIVEQRCLLEISGSKERPSSGRVGEFERLVRFRCGRHEVVYSEILIYTPRWDSRARGGEDEEENEDEELCALRVK